MTQNDLCLYCNNTVFFYFICISKKSVNGRKRTDSLTEKS